MSNTQNGANYRITFNLKPQADLAQIYQALRPLCAEPQRDQPFQPSVTIIGMVDRNLINDAGQQPGVTGSPHYIPKNSYEMRPLPYDAYLRAIVTLAAAYRQTTQDQNWHPIQLNDIDTKALHLACQMFTQEWVTEHTAYPMRPSIDVPKFSEPNLDEYLASWGISATDLLTKQYSSNRWTRPLEQTS